MTLQGIKLGVALVLLVTLFVRLEAAVPFGMAASKRERRASSNPPRRPPSPFPTVVTRSLPLSAQFREADGRGLLVKTWINGRGAFTFAIDTGAGAIILSRRVATEARVGIARERNIEISGLSGATGGAGQKASVQMLAVGSSQNFLPSRGLVIVTDALPSGVDGVLDPTEAYSPFGYSIDMPKGEISAFDPQRTPLRAGAAPQGGVVVRWLREAGGRRPFVMLDGGKRALLDTGSGFGLAVSEDAARTIGIAEMLRRDASHARQTYDLAGGRVTARRMKPATIYVGSLMLRGVPTDFLLHAEAGAPILLGRDALRPFRLMFDPLSQLIQIRPS
ncbi:MAG TPA: aspartyl protease family protein [Pyrinomonadaceae bacterium]|nr:aspartyl protease family protein [Pyrinomonadaceae bacterium]